MGRETNKHSSFTPQIRFALQRSRVSGLKKQALPGKSKAVAPDLATNAHKSFAWTALNFADSSNHPLRFIKTTRVNKIYEDF